MTHEGNLGGAKILGEICAFRNDINVLIAQSILHPYSTRQLHNLCKPTVPDIRQHSLYSRHNAGHKYLIMSHSLQRLDTCMMMMMGNCDIKDGGISVNTSRSTSEACRDSAIV